jgi:hypothetical protein
MGGVNAAAAMAMLQGLLSNPANLSLMMAQSPWMAQHLLAGMGGPAPNQHGGHLGQGMPPPPAGQGMPPVDPGALAAAAQFGQQLGAAGMGNIAGALNGLGLGGLPHGGQQQGGPQGGAGNHMQQHSPPSDVSSGWMPNGGPNNAGMMFYQNAGAGPNGAMERTWGDHR